MNDRKKSLSKRLQALYRTLNQNEGVDHVHLGKTGWITRQSLSRSRERKGGTIEFVSAAESMALITLACERGYLTDVIQALLGSKIQFGASVIASSIFPDITPDEAAMLLRTEAAFEESSGKHLDVATIRALVTASRAPT